MKKVYLLILSLLLILSSCGFRDRKPSPSKVAKSHASTIIECFNTGDIETLKSLFCENIQNTHNLDKEIAEAIEFIDGKIISEGDWYGMYAGGESVREGKLVKQDVHPGMENVITDTGSIYRIVFASYLVYENDKKNVGMIYITIYDETNGTDNRNECNIGDVIW